MRLFIVSNCYKTARRLRYVDNNQQLRLPSLRSISGARFLNQQLSSRDGTPSTDAQTTHFGFENVPTEEKEGRVRQVFENVADSYDVMNDIMSGGLHRYWKDVLVEETKVGPMAHAVRRHNVSTLHNGDHVSLKILDVAGGTGDVAFRMVDAADCMERSKSSGEDSVSVTVCDINPEMLRVGRDRAQERFGLSLLQGSRGLDFQEGNAQDLPFEDNSFDLYTIAFGLRNVTDVDRALKEACRVLKPGGRYFCLEFSHVPHALLRSVYDAYSFRVIPSMGDMVAGDRDSYQYLVESIRKFPKQEELIAKMENAGLLSCSYSNMTGGVVAIHQGWKPL